MAILHGGYELIVFANGELARDAGFENGRHREDPNILCWWLGQGKERLLGLVLARVIVTGFARRSIWGYPQQEHKFYEAMGILRTRLREGKRVWIDLQW
jgi:hypothetical protein